MISRISPLLVGAVALSISASALAQGDAPSPVAQALYDEAARAMAAHDYATACPKLEQVVQMSPTGVGAKKTLGQCYEGAGRLASAWSAYSAAEALAARTGQSDRAASIRALADALKPRLSTLVLIVPADVQALPNLVVKTDGAILGRPAFGVPLPMDRGKHVVTASATGKRPWKAEYVVETEKTTGQLTVGPMVDADKFGAGGDGAGADARRPPFWPAPVAGVAGLVFIGAGITMFALAGSKSSDASKALGAIHGFCQPTVTPGDETACSQAKSDGSSHDTFQTLGVTGVAVGGAAVVAAGAYYFWYRSKTSGPNTAVTVAPMIASGAHGAVLELRF